MTKAKTTNKAAGKTLGSAYKKNHADKAITGRFRDSNERAVSPPRLAKGTGASKMLRRAVKPRPAARPRFDFSFYAQLLTEVVPRVINSQEEYDRIEAKFETLFDKGDARAPEEDSLFDLLANLLLDYEKRTLPPLEPSSPADTLKFLMEQNGLNQTDMVEYFGSQGNVSQVLAGKRAISKGAARKLSERFKVSTDVFLMSL